MLLNVKSVARERIRRIKQKTTRNERDAFKAGSAHSMRQVLEQGVYESLSLGRWVRSVHYISAGSVHPVYTATHLADLPHH